MKDGRIAADGLVKQYADVTAVDDLSFSVEPGRVTGFLGPNGAGKTTTLRMVLNLVTPTRGTATIGGRRYADLEQPTRVVGAVLEASAAHAGRTGRNHLRAVCLAAGFPQARADEVLELVGLTPAADRTFRGYSLGMRQRLGIEGVRWMRELLQGLADEGRTVLVSSHLLGEMQALADDVVIVAAGRLLRQGPVHQVIAGVPSGLGQVEVVTPEPDKLADALTRAGATISSGVGALHVTGMDVA